MSNEGGEDLKNLLEERRKAVERVEFTLANMGIKIGDVLTVRYRNGTSETKPYNGWLENEAGTKYIKLGTASVPAAYIVDIQKES